MINALNRFTGAIVGGVNGLLGGAAPSLVLLVHALIIAVLAVAVYALVSNQRSVKATRNRMVARLLEIRMFQSDPISVFRSFGRVLAAIGSYLGASLKPLLLILPIVVLWIGQLSGWFEWRPLAPGESAVVSMKLRKGVSPVAQPATLQVPDGFVVETPAFRSLNSNEVAWRVKAVQSARGVLRCSAGGATAEKDIVASSSLEKVSTRKVAEGFWDQVLWPGEDSLAKDTPISEVRLDYPRRSMKFFGHETNWLVALCVASIALALIVKKPFGVEF